MKCTCGADVPRPDDPTARAATCPDCGSEIDLLAAAPEATIVAGSVDAASAASGAAPAPPQTDDLLGRILGDGRYRIDSVIGRGGMGTVYLGTQTNLNRRVAIKVLAAELTADEHFVARFQREAGTLAALEHQHITSVFDVGVEDGLHYIVMAYVAGPQGTPASLRELMQAGPMEEEAALRLIGQICNALHYAHQRGIVHRDIKPGNILIDETSAARIADFGIARAGLAHEKTLTLPGTVMGSLRYMSPEQKLDAAKVDARSDLYSLGVMFYEMLVGHVPEGRFALPSQERSELDRRIDTIIDRVLQIKPEARYQTAADVQRDLSSITTERLIQRTKTSRQQTKKQARAKKPKKQAPKPAAKPDAPEGPKTNLGVDAVAAAKERFRRIPKPVWWAVGLSVVVLAWLASRDDESKSGETPTGTANRTFKGTPEKAREPDRPGPKGGQQTLEGFARIAFRALRNRDEALFKTLLVNGADRAELWRASNRRVSIARLIEGRNQELEFFRDFVDDTEGASLTYRGVSRPQTRTLLGLPYVRELPMEVLIDGTSHTITGEGLFKLSRGWVMTSIVQ